MMSIFICVLSLSAQKVAEIPYKTNDGTKESYPPTKDLYKDSLKIFIKIKGHSDH